MSRKHAVLYDVGDDSYSVIFQDEGDPKWYTLYEGVQEEVATIVTDKLNEEQGS